MSNAAIFPPELRSEEYDGEQFDDGKFDADGNAVVYEHQYTAINSGMERDRSHVRQSLI